MKKFILFFCLLIFISLVAFIFFFNPEEIKFKTESIPNKFSILIPEYLSRTDSLDSSALLQYKNEKKQIFLLVYEITDTANLSLKDFFMKTSDDFISRISHSHLIKYYPLKINNQQAFVGNIRGSVNETRVYYRIAVIQTAADSFYKIIVGISDNNLNRYDEDINRIINSIAQTEIRQ